MAAACRVLSLAIALGAATSAMASRIVSTELVCPMDGRTFTVQDWDYVRVGSLAFDLLYNAHFGQMSVRAQPVCDKGFVVYKPSFTPDEVARLKPYVESAGYQALREIHSTYYLSARLRQLVGEPMRDVALDLVHAMREVDDMQELVQFAARDSVRLHLRDKYGQVTGHPQAEFNEMYAVELKRRQDDLEKRRNLYATEALAAYKKALVLKYDDKESWLQDQLRAGELERRLGRFADARARFVKLSADPAVSTIKLYDGLDNKVILDGQLELIAKKDQLRHGIASPSQRQAR